MNPFLFPVLIWAILEIFLLREFRKDYKQWTASAVLVLVSVILIGPVVALCFYFADYFLGTVKIARDLLHFHQMNSILIIWSMCSGCFAIMFLWDVYQKKLTWKDDYSLFIFLTLGGPLAFLSFPLDWAIEKLYKPWKQKRDDHKNRGKIQGKNFGF